MPRHKPNDACPVGQCIQEELSRVFTSAEDAMIHQLSRTTVADVIDSVHRKCAASARAK